MLKLHHIALAVLVAFALAFPVARAQRPASHGPGRGLRSGPLHQVRVPHPHARRRPLFTAVYVPKDAAPTTSILPGEPHALQRCVRTVRTSPGAAWAPTSSGAGYIFVVQDVRGRYMSEGKFPGDVSAHRREEDAAGCGRELRHVRHRGVAAEARAVQQRESRHLGDLLPRLLHLVEHH